jgi:hypothetical protein
MARTSFVNSAVFIPNVVFRACIFGPLSSTYRWLIQVANDIQRMRRKPVGHIAEIRELLGAGR